MKETSENVQIFMKIIRQRAAEHFRNVNFRNVNKYFKICYQRFGNSALLVYGCDCQRLCEN